MMRADAHLDSTTFSLAAAHKPLPPPLHCLSGGQVEEVLMLMRKL